jgi:uncharacterized protein (UPF0264 family)
MRLLVSVRSVDEVRAALAGGADIIDVKEPLRGALGAADPEVVKAIAAKVPSSIPVSVALGDPADTAVVQATVTRLAPHREAGEVILKLGFAGATTEIEAEKRLRAAIDIASSGTAPTLVAVAYADWPHAGGPSPSAVVRVAARAGARGVLLDTFIKDSGNLFSSISPRALPQWIEEARSLVLLVAVAGSLDAEGIVRLLSPLPDVVGVRGAACHGGRLGRVSAERVRALRLLVDAFDSRPDPRKPTANRQTVASCSNP